jgi:hypothetical protein
LLVTQNYCLPAEQMNRLREITTSVLKEDETSVQRGDAHW